MILYQFIFIIYKTPNNMKTVSSISDKLGLEKIYHMKKY